MLVMNGDDAAERAHQCDLVRRSYDAISLAYRSDDGPPAPSAHRRNDTHLLAPWTRTRTNRTDRHHTPESGRMNAPCSEECDGPRMGGGTTVAKQQAID